MFDNLLYQNATSLLSSDIASNSVPGALLFSGSQGSGKLTCALETARILSCTGEKKGYWLCSCKSCLQHKALVNTNVLLAGSRDCAPEIAAAARTFCFAVEQNARYLASSRYLFLRSVRKLTMRFNPILWQGDDKLNKIAALVGEIDEELEILDFPHEIPESSVVQKTCEKLIKLCLKLENDFLYDSVPILQIRNVSSWARLKSTEGKKTIIIENADRMLEAVRNALLKILEEPPEDTVFILTTTRRNAVMPTILSRVRTYNFLERTLQEQHEVISRVFHNEGFEGSIGDFLLTYLPVKPEILKKEAVQFFSMCASYKIPETATIIKNCGGFDPRIMLRIFLSEIQIFSKKLLNCANGASSASELSVALQNCWKNVTSFNQNIQAALDVLVRDLSKINKTHGNIFQWAIT